MTFGFNNIPRVFTGIMKKAIQAIREIWKVRCVIYLDDLLILKSSKRKLEVFKDS
jgi:hypothetical protein